MCVFCSPEAFPGLARRAVLLIPPIHLVPPQLPLYTSHPPLSLLQSTLARLSANVDSTTLTKNSNPLAATLTKKGSRGSPLSPTKFVNSLLLVCHFERSEKSLCPPISPLVHPGRSRRVTRHRFAHVHTNSTRPCRRNPILLIRFRTVSVTHGGVGVAPPRSFQVLLHLFPVSGFCLRRSAAWRRRADLA